MIAYVLLLCLGVAFADKPAPTTAAPAYPQPASSEAGTIAEVVASDSRFSTLLSAVSAADLAETLSGDGPFTVFAPNNQAFDGVTGLADLVADKEALTKVLLRHVVSGSAVLGKDVPPGDTELETAGGEKITVSRRENYIFVTAEKGDEASVVEFDIEASNGVIHAINAVI